jgi:hypothetical protein
MSRTQTQTQTIYLNHDIIKSLKIFQLPSNFVFTNEDTKKILKMKYYKLCIQYHPDKNPNGKEMFQDINNAYNILINHYDFLNNNITNNNDDNKNIDENLQYNNDDIYENLYNDLKNEDYKSIVNKYIRYLCKEYNINIPESILTTIEQKLTDINIIEIIDNLLKNYIEIQTHKKNQTHKNVKTFQQKFKQTTEQTIKDGDINEIQLNNNLKPVREKNEKQVHTIYPNLEDILDSKIYILDYNDKKYYIPLWHSILHFDDLIVNIEPNLTNNKIWIDDDNHINIKKGIKCCDLFRHISNNIEYLPIKITDTRYINIPINELKCVKKQKYISYKKGIPKINSSDIYDNKNLSNIIIHIEINL